MNKDCHLWLVLWPLVSLLCKIYHTPAHDPEGFLQQGGLPPVEPMNNQSINANLSNMEYVPDHFKRCTESVNNMNAITYSLQ